MFCANCGQKLDDDAKFCNYCGVPVEEEQGTSGKKASFLDSILSIFRRKKEPAWKGAGAGRIPAGQTPADLMRQPAPAPAPKLVMEDDDDDCTQKLDDMWLNGMAPEPTGIVILQGLEDPSRIYGCSLENPVIVGRNASDCNVVIEGDKSISRKHCRLFKDGGACYVEDLNSNNHTFINDVMLTEPAPLKAGDILRLGKLELAVTECDMDKSMQ